MSNKSKKNYNSHNKNKNNYLQNQEQRKKTVYETKNNSFTKNEEDKLSSKSNTFNNLNNTSNSKHLSNENEKNKNCNLKNDYSNDLDKQMYSFNKKNCKKNIKHPFVNIILILTLLSSLIYFGANLFYGQKNTEFFSSFFSNLILVIFSILFISVCITIPKQRKGTILLSSLLLLLFNIIGILSVSNIVSIPSSLYLDDFTGKSLTEVVKWAQKNKIDLIQDYEYNDLVPAYSIIAQDSKEGTKIKDIKQLTISVSEGPSPNKEIILPNMVGWDSSRVIQYVKDNYLSNVNVEFIESDKAKDTVIEQNKVGSIERNEEINLKFSLGEEADNSDVKIIDLTNKSEFEATFYLKQHRISYEIERDFSSKIIRGNVSKQNKKPGSMIPVNSDDKLIVTISKGKKIKVPNLKNMSMTEITEWIIKNKLKLEFSDRYDDTIKENRVIEANYSEGDSLEQGSLVKVVISKGCLIMDEFNSLGKFIDWANKYDIDYEEKHEFSDDVPIGEVISYSYKKGDIIKNGDSITVVISDGKECKVPNLIGLSKKEIINKLESLGLNYNFVYQNSTKQKDKAIRQSIDAGSKVSNGTTITVTLSNGKKDVDSNNDSSSNNNNNNDNSKPEPNPEPEPEVPSCDYSQKTRVYIYDELLSNNPTTTCNNIKSAYPKVKFTCQFISNGPGIGLLVNTSEIDSKDFNHCDTYVLKIQKN